MFLFACNHTQQANLPSTKFSEEYTLSDFNLNDDYSYWEIRQGNNHYQDEEHTVLQKFDEEKHAQLSSKQKYQLNALNIDYGFDSKCLPDYCPVYGAALLNDSIFTVQSKSELLTFFQHIDTEAEVYIYLSTQGSTAKAYEKNALGYKVLLAWDNSCGSRGENLVQVYSDGTVEVIQELSTTEYDGCI